MVNHSFQVIVLAAGKGTRMKSALPKVLHWVCGRTLIARVLSAVAELKPARITVVIGHGEELMRKELDALASQALFSGIEILPVVQSEQRGTGHAVQIALAGLKSDNPKTLILPGDIPLLRTETLRPFLAEFETSKADLSVLTFKPEDATGFGRIVRGASGEVQRIVEHRDCSVEELRISEVNSSIYLVNTLFLRESVTALKPNNAQGELYLTDIVSIGARSKKIITAHCIPCADDVAGANTRAELAALVSRCRARINEAFMLNGVTMEDPTATYVDDTVTVGSDVYLGAGTRLYGDTALGDNVIIEGQSKITNSRIGSGSVIKFCCDVEGAELAPRCHIGPFARLRPGTVLSSDVRIGNFVETKNATLAAGAKANHLTYLGDAVIGANANVGAGTITCNYDGVNKHKTEIGEAAFIGSNTSLVAPVRIGAGAVIGAGSVITKEVPAGALALERSSQSVIEKWAERRPKTKTAKKTHS